MKYRHMVFPLLAALLLTACGGGSPETGEASGETGALPAPCYLAFAPGETAMRDLDGDGEAEEIRLWLEDAGDYDRQVRLTVNGQDLSDALTETREAPFDCPDEDCWLLTDLDAGDGLVEIAVQDWGPSNDLTTSFYRYGEGDGTLRYLGQTEGFVCWEDAPADVRFDGDGTVHSYRRFGVLQTWWGEADSALDETGLLVPVPRDYYPAIVPREDFQPDAQVPQSVTVLSPLLGYDAPGGQPDLLPAGTELALLGTDDAEWVRVRLAGEDRELWLRLDPENPFSLEGPEGFADGWEALDGLCMAD